MRPDPIEKDTPQAEAAFEEALGGDVRVVTRIEGAADILHISSEGLANALEVAWNEGQLSDVAYRNATESLPGVDPAKATPFDDMGKLRDETEDIFALERNVDNWKHRSQGMKCATCMWWVSKVAGLYMHEDGSVETVMEGRGKLGRCRRSAPVVGKGFPAMYTTDWCGDHKIDEEKLNGDAS